MYICKQQCGAFLTDMIQLMLDAASLLRSIAWYDGWHWQLHGSGTTVCWLVPRLYRCFAWWQAQWELLASERSTQGGVFISPLARREARSSVRATVTSAPTLQHGFSRMKGPLHLIGTRGVRKSQKAIDPSLDAEAMTPA